MAINLKRIAIIALLVLPVAVLNNCSGPVGPDPVPQSTKLGG